MRSRHSTLFASLLFACLWANPAAAQDGRLVGRIAAAGPFGTAAVSNLLVGGGVTYELREALQLFADAELEFGHSYEPDTYSRSDTPGVPYVVVILNAPLRGYARCDQMAAGGLRLTTPRERTVRSFLAAGAGYSRIRRSFDFPDVDGTVRTSRTTSRDGYVTLGGGFSGHISPRVMVEGEYRRFQPWSDAGLGLHVVQASIDLTF